MNNQTSVIPLYTDFKINLDVNPETFEEWEKQWLEEHPSEKVEPKRYYDFYDELIEGILGYFQLDGFENHDYDTDTPLYYVSFDYKIEQYWKAENEDVIIWDFEGNMYKHRYTITFSPKTLKGLHLISSYLLSIQEEEWFMEINTDKLFRP